MAKEKSARGKIVVTPKGRLSYPQLFTAKAYDQNGKPEYSTEILFDKKDEKAMAFLKTLATECKKLAQEAFGTTKSIKLPIRDGEDKADKAGYAGCYFIRAKSRYRPNTVNGDMTPTEEADIYGGCYARLSIVPYTYSMAGNKGVSLQLNNVQRLSDGERFGGGGGTRAEDDFDTLEDEETPFETDEGEDDLGL